MNCGDRLAAIVSANILRRRKASGYSQVYFAKRLKKAAPFVHVLETGKAVPTLRTIALVARVLKCEPWELLQDEWSKVKGKKRC
jgi:transcriptional regulator with XRE-family HTH domain